MGKKRKEELAPAYMGLYSSLMILLLAFFILLNSMASVQEAGFKSGIGQVQNAFGWKGGYGIMRFTFLSKGAAKAPGDQNVGDEGMNKNTMVGKGGSGMTDVQYADADSGKYLKMVIPEKFPKDSSEITPELASFLERMGLWLLLFKNQITIKCYAGDSGELDRDRDLAMNRALRIKEFLKVNGRIPDKRIVAVGYPEPTYVCHNDAERKQAASDRQAIFFYIFKKTPSAGDKPL